MPVGRCMPMHWRRPIAVPPTAESTLSQYLNVAVNQHYETNLILTNVIHFHNHVLSASHALNVLHCYRESVVKRKTVPFLLTCMTVCCATLSGCASNAFDRNPDRHSGRSLGHGPDHEPDRAADLSLISHTYDARVIDCALPFMSEHDIAHAEIAYHYRNTAVTFVTASSALVAHLQACAAPSAGPNVSFEGTIDIWPAKTS